MEEEIKKEKTLAIEGRSKEQKRKDRDQAEYERREKRAALKAAIADELCTNKIEDVTLLPTSGKLISEDGKIIYHMKAEGVLTSLCLDGFENQPFLLDNMDFYRFVWQHELSYLTSGGCIKKLFQDATTAETYLKLNGKNCVWSPLSGFWTHLNSDFLNNGNITNESDSLPRGFYMAVESDFNISILIRVIQKRYKLTKAQLAQRLGYDHASIIFIEKGKQPSDLFYDRLAKAFPEYERTVTQLRKNNTRTLCLEDMTENLIDGILLVRPFNSKLSATFKKEGIQLETEGIEFLYRHRDKEMLCFELEKFPDEGFKVIGVFNKVMIEGIADLKEFMKSSGKLSNKLGIGGLVFSSCLIEGKQEVVPDDESLQELNYALYDVDDCLDFTKSNTVSGTLAEAMTGVRGAITDNDNPQK